MFGVVLKVIGSKMEAKWFLAVLAKKYGPTSWDFGQNLKLC